MKERRLFLAFSMLVAGMLCQPGTGVVAPPHAEATLPVAQMILLDGGPPSQTNVDVALWQADIEQLPSDNRQAEWMPVYDTAKPVEIAKLPVHMEESDPPARYLDPEGI